MYNLVIQVLDQSFTLILHYKHTHGEFIYMKSEPQYRVSVLYRYQVNVTSNNIMRIVTFRTCETGKNINVDYSLCSISDYSVQLPLH